MTTFVAIYRGKTVAEAKVVAVSADPQLVGDVSTRLLQSQAGEPLDPVLDHLEDGRRKALWLIKRESQSAAK